MKICFIGDSSEIVKSVQEKLKQNDKSDFDFITVSRSKKSNHYLNIGLKKIDYSVVPDNCDFYLISLGILYPKRILQQSYSERTLSINVNLLAPVLISEMLLKKNKKARIVIIGSESGSKGSFDTTYFLSKAALVSYVRERKVSHAEQSLNLISPSTISDSSMTKNRNDLMELTKTFKFLPKKRALYSSEVANIIVFLINGGDSYISNEEIAVNGGKFARMEYH